MISVFPKTEYVVPNSPMVKQTLQLLVSQATPGWMISVDGHEQYKADALTGPWSVYSQGVAPAPTVPCLVSKCMVLLSQVIFQYFGGLPPKVFVRG